VSYRPSLKKLKKGEIERVSDRIFHYSIRKDRPKVKISPIEGEQTSQIILFLSPDHSDSNVCVAELGYGYPTEKLRNDMYEKVIKTVGKMFGDYNRELYENFVKDERKEKEKPRYLKIIRSN